MDITALMHRPVYTVTPETPWCQAQEFLQQHGLRYVPVLQDAAPVGLLSAREFWRAAPSVVPALARYEWPAVLARLRVQDVMSVQLCTLPVHTPVRQAVQALSAASMPCLLLTDANRLVGMVTMEDLLAALLSQLEAQGPVRYERILVATDCRATSMPVLRTALALARQHRARLTVLRVLPFSAAYLPIDLDHGAPAMVTLYQEERRAAALEQLTAFVPRHHDVPVDVQAVEGEPWIAVVKTGVKVPADLIVIGASQQRRRGMMTTHQASLVVRYAPCPVFVVEE